MTKKRTVLENPYGIMDFKRLRREGCYYVDKTEYLAQMVNCELVGEKGC